MTTYEAVARAVGLLEGSPLLAEQLLAPLRLMTQHQVGRADGAMPCQTVCRHVPQR